MALDPATLDRYRHHAAICKVLTDPKRLLLLASLRDGDHTVGELATSIGTTLPNASQHLAVLRSAGLVDGRREGATVRYRLAEPTILDACDIVGRIVEGRLAPRAAVPSADPGTATAVSASSASLTDTPAVTAG
jgi:DNA-binding transcriptional ArsR family regulator